MPATLIYDASCPLCNAAREWVAQNAIPGEFDFVPCQSEERARRFPRISEKQCMEAMQLVYPDGRSFSGDRALPEILLGIRRWRSLARVLRVPPVSLISPLVYRAIARNRMAISALIARKTALTCPGDACDETSQSSSTES
jgi:predicted DCC family thiol-disulfide oxidoreductase YuxK